MGRAVTAPARAEAAQETLAVPCPRCLAGTVAVQRRAWVERPSGFPRRSVWVDEPCRCARSCALSAQDVERLLRAADAAPAGAAVRQLPLPLERIREEAVA